ncbi:MAG: hypothetical protein VX015_10725 [Planctomycetota bacterium]|nr:hypothetical protein [Planctomycetota bacterium]
MSEAPPPVDRPIDDLPQIEHDPELDGPAPAAALAQQTAGGVAIVRATESGPRLAVLESGGVVSLPKAEAGPGMSAETAAHRAAEAFVGQRVRLLESIGETRERLDGDDVVTWFWLARPGRAAALDPAEPPPPGFELHWIDLEEAEQALTSEGERALVTRLAGRTFPHGRRPFDSLETRGLAAELEAFRDENAAAVDALEDEERIDALMRAHGEIERAETRLARGDTAGARRARARAERERLASLDAHGRGSALLRAIERAPAHMRSSLRAAAPASGSAVSLDALLAIQTAVDTAVEEQERALELRRAAQLRATTALLATALTVVTAGALGLFDVAAELGAGGATTLFAVAGLLGGWVGEALFVVREPDRGQHVAQPLTSASGAVAGLALGAILTRGFATLSAENAALILAAAFAAGWFVRTLLPRETHARD